MQVDLFDDVLVGRTKRQIKQIATRGYKIDKRHRTLEGIRPYCRDEHHYRLYKEYFMKLISDGRKYQSIGDAMEDSLFEVEALGIANNGQPYVLVADYSSCLDYILHRLYGCKISDIRAIDDYDRISKAILSYDFKNASDIPLSRLILASDELSTYFASLAYESKDEILECNDRISWMAYQFYKDVLSTLGFIKFYTTVVLCNSFMSLAGRKGIIRSTSFSKIAAASSVMFNDVVKIHDRSSDNIEDYEIVYRTYCPYEYFGEVIIKDELSRKV